MKYTILTAVLNRRADIQKMYQSVISQTYLNYELVIVDNGSSDGTYELCKEWELANDSVRVFRCDNRGLAFARNVGIRKAESDYCIILDSDNLLFSSHSLTQINDIVKRYRPLGLFTCTQNEFGYCHSRSTVFNSFVDLDQYLNKVKGEFAAIVNTSWFKEHTYPEFPGVISELPLLVWIPLAKTGEMFIGDCITQVYTVNSSDNISHSTLSKDRLIELTVYYYEICRRYSSDLCDISRTLYLKLFIKLLLYNRWSRHYGLLEVSRLRLGTYGLFSLCVPRFVVSFGILTYKSFLRNRLFNKGVIKVRGLD